MAVVIIYIYYQMFLNALVCELFFDDNDYNTINYVYKNRNMFFSGSKNIFYAFSTKFSKKMLISKIFNLKSMNNKFLI